MAAPGAAAAWGADGGDAASVTAAAAGVTDVVPELAVVSEPGVAGASGSEALAAQLRISQEGSSLAVTRRADPDVTFALRIVIEIGAPGSLGLLGGLSELRFPARFSLLGDELEEALSAHRAEVAALT